MHWLVIPALALSCFLNVWDADLALVAILALTGLAVFWQFATGKWHMSAFPAPLSWFFLLFGLWAGLSTLWTDTPYDTWRALSVWLLLPVWAWLLAALEPRKLKTLVLAAGAVVLAMAVIAYWQLSLFNPDDNFRPPSLFANPNTFASLIAVMLLPWQHVWLGRAGDKADWRRIAGAILLFVLFGALAMTASRIALIGFAAVSLFQLALLRDLVRAHWKQAALYLCGLIITYIIINTETGHLISDRFQIIAQPVSTSERLLVWQTTIEAWLLTPMLGHGFAALSAPYAALRHFDDGTFGQFAHSDPLQYLAELGPIGLGLSIAIALAFIGMSWARWRGGFANPDHRLWFEAVATGIFVLIASSLVTYILYLPALLLSLAILLGLWAALYWAEAEPLATKRRPLSGALFALGFAVLAGLHFSGSMTTHAARQLRSYSLEGHYEANHLASRLSFDLNPVVLLEWADVALSHASQTENKDALARIDNTLDRLERLQPSLPQLWLLRARVALVHRDYAEAAGFMRQAIGQDPTFVPAIVMLGKLHRELGQESEIEPLYEQALRWRLIRAKYHILTMDDLLEREKSLPRLTKSR